MDEATVGHRDGQADGVIAHCAVAETAWAAGVARQQLLDRDGRVRWIDREPLAAFAEFGLQCRNVAPLWTVTVMSSGTCSMMRLMALRSMPSMRDFAAFALASDCCRASMLDGVNFTFVSVSICDLESSIQWTASNRQSTIENTFPQRPICWTAFEKPFERSGFVRFCPVFG